MGALGFALIGTGLAVGYGGGAVAHENVAYISAGSGIITEFIAAVFFWLYKRTVTQLKEYHDSLLSVQNILLAFKVLEDTREPAERRQMMTEILRFLLNSEFTKSFLHCYFDNSPGV